MISKNVEERLSALETEMAEVKNKLGQTEEGWWRQIAGTFEGDPYYAEAMRLGRKYRESQRPKPRKKNKKLGP